MKARIYILVIVFAAGLVTAGAEDPKTNAVPGVVETAVPPPVTAPAPPAPAVAKEVKPAVGTLAPTSAVPVQPKPTAPPRLSSPEGNATGHKEILTNPPPAEETRPPDAVSSSPTSAVPAEVDAAAAAPTPNTVTPTAEGSGIDRKSTLLIGGAILLVAGGLAVLMWRRANVASHGSLISSALQLTKSDEKHEDKVEENSEAGTDVTTKPGPEAKKEEKKFPPPMT